MTSSSTLAASEMVHLVRNELDARGIPVAVRLSIEKRQYHTHHFMRIGSVEVEDVSLPTGERVEQTTRDLADQAQVALRHIMVAHEARRWLARRGRRTLGQVETPAWGLACHPCILAVLETHGPDGEWMRKRDLIGTRADRAVTFEMSTIVATRMGKDGRATTIMGSTEPLITMRADLAHSPRQTMVNLGYMLPQTMDAVLVGAVAADVLGFPPMQDRVAAAVAAVRVDSVFRNQSNMDLVLAPTSWICAAPLPEDVDPACLSIPLPLR